MVCAYQPTFTWSWRGSIDFQVAEAGSATSQSYVERIAIPGLSKINIVYPACLSNLGSSRRHLTNNRR
jgi:hypothetical protein